MFTQNDSGMRVYSLRHGWGTIDKFNCEGSTFYVKFDNGVHTDFHLDGKSYQAQQVPELYFDKPEIIAPPRPKNKVTKTIERWTGIFKRRGDGFVFTNGIHMNENDVPTDDSDFHLDFINKVKLTGSYEAEE